MPAGRTRPYLDVHRHFHQAGDTAVGPAAAVAGLVDHDQDESSMEGPVDLHTVVAGPVVAAHVVLVAAAAEAGSDMPAVQPGVVGMYAELEWSQSCLAVMSWASM